MELSLCERRLCSNAGDGLAKIGDGMSNRSCWKSCGISRFLDLVPPLTAYLARSPDDQYLIARSTVGICLWKATSVVVHPSPLWAIAD
jgi:hypothetical protein